MEKRHFPKGMLRDQHPRKVEENGRQIGASENAVTEVLWFADLHDHTKSVYTFPAKPAVEDFSKSRVAVASQHYQGVRHRTIPELANSGMVPPIVCCRLEHERSRCELASASSPHGDCWDLLRHGQGVWCVRSAPI